MAVTTTSSTPIASSFIWTLMTLLPLTGTVWFSMPMNEKTSLASLPADMLYAPAAFVVVPTEVPSTTTVTPAIGLPSEPVTVPEICLLWAWESKIPPPSNAINVSRIFLTISVNQLIVK